MSFSIIFKSRPYGKTENGLSLVIIVFLLPDLHVGVILAILGRWGYVQTPEEKEVLIRPIFRDWSN